MNFNDALAELESRGEGRMVPDLDRIRAIAELLNHPEKTYPSVHITGTNGKTTTARLVSRVLCGHGLAAGMYTSPHLSSVTERFALCDEEISEREFAETYEHLLPYLREVDSRGEDRVTYFETLTALAYLWFADKPVDAGVFEVGMGGEWDATNLVDSKVAVFCSIDLDHPELGSTVEEVAKEKAGIIKPGATVVIADPNPATLAVIEARASELDCPALVKDRDFWIEQPTPAVGGQMLDVRTKFAEYSEFFLPLFGSHQAENAAAAIVASEAFLGNQLNADALREALSGVTSPGRLEVVARHPLIVLDGAHNPHAAAAMSEALPDAFVWRRLHLVIGVLETKDVAGIVTPLASRASVAYACANSNERSLDPEGMAAACEAAGIPAKPFATVEQALEAAESEAEDDDLILVTGSLYTVADARPRYVRVRGRETKD
ncbi:MAG: bifunctional folylpolyglutamate synthase/dihydrofolate synthase [Actinomycetota bacterium]